jgi:hypothetical protein
VIIDLLRVLRTTVTLEPSEEIAWKAGARTTVLIQTVEIEQFDNPASLTSWRKIRSITVTGYRKESGWRRSAKTRTFYGSQAIPQELHALIDSITSH